MHSAQSAKHVLSIAAAAALLAGCSGGATSQLAPGANSAIGAAGVIHNGHLLTTSVLNPKFASRESNTQPRTQPRTHPLRGKIAANLKTLWLSGSGYNEIQIYTFPSGKYIGTAPPPPEGFSEPQGMCSDKAGDVFVANTENSTIDEYAGSGTFMQALSDPGEFPVGCGVDPASGTLAVSNIISTSDNAGGISLYKNAAGKPQVLTDPNMFEVFFIAYYGSTGKLYYSGFDNSFGAAISSYANGTFKIFTVNGVTFSFPGTVAWANKTKSLAIGGQDTSIEPTFYHVKANGNVTGSTVLACQSGYCDVPQATVKGKYIVAGTGVFAYPAGGDPLFTIGNSLDEAIGSAVSVVKQ